MNCPHNWLQQQRRSQRTRNRQGVQGIGDDGRGWVDLGTTTKDAALWWWAWEIGDNEGGVVRVIWSLGIKNDDRGIGGGRRRDNTPEITSLTAEDMVSVCLLVLSLWPHSVFIIGWWYSIPEQRLYETLDSAPLKFKVNTWCTRLSSPPNGVQIVSPPPRYTPIHWSRLRPGTPPPPCLLRSRPLRFLPWTLSPSTPLFPDPLLLMLFMPFLWLPSSWSPSVPTTS